MTSTTSQTGYPAHLTGELDPNLSRGMWLVKWFLAIPHYIVLAFLWVAFLVTTVIAGFAILFTGRYPRSLFDFNVGVMRWNWRVAFYALSAIGTDRYPPFTLARTDYPADFDVDYPEHLSHGLVLVKSWLLAIPHLIIVGLITANVPYWWTTRNEWNSGESAAGISLLGMLVVIAGLILLFTRTIPPRPLRPDPWLQPLGLPRHHLCRPDARRVPALPSGSGPARTRRRARRPRHHTATRRRASLRGASTEPNPEPASRQMHEGARTWNRSTTGRWPAGRCWSPAAPEASARRPPWAWPPWAHTLRSPAGTAGAPRPRLGEIRAAGGGQVDVFVADLSAQSEVRRLADEVLQRLSRIDVLVNNVGGYWNTRHVTADGLERTFALNHLAPFLLTNLLLDRLTQSAPARVVTVSSNAQAMGRIDFDDLQGLRSYSGARAYNQSKLANVLFSYELARRLHGTSVTANALHPGVVSTSFGAEDPATVQRLFIPFLRPFMKTPAQGAATSIHLASAPDLEQVTRPLLRRQQTQEDPPSAATTRPPRPGSGRSAPTWSA